MDAPRLFKSFLTRPAAAGSAPLLPTRDFCGLGGKVLMTSLSHETSELVRQVFFGKLLASIGKG